MSDFYSLNVRFLRFLVRLFFREVEVTGLENLPREGGGILVSWHPNGLIDPGLILTHFPRQVIFGARDGLFRWPILGSMMRQMGSVPIYRAKDRAKADPAARRSANAASLDALAEAVAAGRFSCLFPEGDSHDSPHLLELKTGTARFYYRARELAERTGQAPVIIPVGLHYDAKRAFRSSVLISFHPPITIPDLLDLLPHPDEPPEAERERCRGLTDEIERVLREVVHATESWELHHLMHRVRKLMRAERALRAGAKLHKPKMAERTLGFARVWAGYYTRLQTHPAEVERLRKRIEDYNRDLRLLGIEDHELDHPPALASPWLPVILVLQVVLVFLLLPPILLVGYAVNILPALALMSATRFFAKRKKDEATIKLLLGALLFPATWALVGVLAATVHQELHSVFPAMPNTPVLAGVLAVVLSIVGGMIALRYVRLARETMRALQVRLTLARRRSALARLRVERAELHDAVLQLIGDLDLPGAVNPSGQVVSDASHQDQPGWTR